MRGRVGGRKDRSKGGVKGSFSGENVKCPSVPPVSIAGVLIGRSDRNTKSSGVFFKFNLLYKELL